MSEISWSNILLNAPDFVCFLKTSKLCKICIPERIITSRLRAKSIFSLTERRKNKLSKLNFILFINHSQYFFNRGKTLKSFLKTVLKQWHHSILNGNLLYFSGIRSTHYSFTNEIVYF